MELHIVHNLSGYVNVTFYRELQYMELRIIFKHWFHKEKVQFS